MGFYPWVKNKVFAGDLADRFNDLPDVCILVVGSDGGLLGLTHRTQHQTACHEEDGNKTTLQTITLAGKASAGRQVHCVAPLRFI